MAGLLFPLYWLLVTTGVGMNVMLMYYVVVFLFEHFWVLIQGLRWLLGFTMKPKPELLFLGPRCFAMLFIGFVGLFMLTGLLYETATRSPFNSFFRGFGSALLVMTDFAHDKTCAVSSETHWVAPLKDRKDLEGTKVLIADVSSIIH